MRQAVSRTIRKARSDRLWKSAAEPGPWEYLLRPAPSNQSYKVDQTYGGNHMSQSRNLIGLLAIAVALSFVVTASAQEGPFRFQGSTCTAGAAYLHCPDREC